MNNGDRKKKANHKTNQKQKDTIVNIKNELISKGLYSFEQYKSIDVYKAVIENNVTNIDEFLSLFKDR